MTKFPEGISGVAEKIHSMGLKMVRTTFTRHLLFGQNFVNGYSQFLHRVYIPVLAQRPAGATQPLSATRRLMHKRLLSGGLIIW